MSETPVSPPAGPSRSERLAAAAATPSPSTAPGAPKDALAVRGAVAPFVERKLPVQILLICMGLSVLYDLFFQPGWILLFDLVVVASAYSLYQALRGFDAADHSGSTADMATALEGLMRYVKINTIMGIGALVMMVVGFVLIVGLLMAGASLWGR